MILRLGLAILLPIAAGPLWADDAIPLTPRSKIVLATPAQARTVLAAKDRFTAELSRFDLESRLATNQPVSTGDLLEVAAEQALSWEAEEREKLSASIASVRDRLAEYAVPFPEQILLIKTTGREEGNAAYCRSNAIILPRARIATPPPRLERLLLHELFHILSSHDEELRRALYAIVGFRPCPPIELPADLAQRKITNPDAPALNYYAEIEIDEQPHRVVPLLYSKTRYDSEAGGSFFSYLQFQLLAVEPHEDRWRPVRSDGQLQMFDPNRTPAFRRLIGDNTKYIYHPDEILADNFVHLALQTPDLPNPEIISKMAEILKADDRPLARPE